jgi:predicted transcriptional regulator
MSGDGINDSGERRTTRDDDLAMESAVLQRLIDVHPARLTLPELVRELAGEEVDFSVRDAVERAARELSGVGLIHLKDDFVTPTRAALRYTELIDR